MGESLRELRNLSPEERKKKLEEVRTDLMHDRGVAAMGGAPPNPGRIRALRKTIARLLTLEREEKKQGGR